MNDPAARALHLSVCFMRAVLVLRTQFPLHPFVLSLVCFVRERIHVPFLSASWITCFLCLYMSLLASHQEAWDKQHCTMPEALAVGQRMGAQRIILTHFSQRYPHMPSALTEGFGTNVCLAFDNMRCVCVCLDISFSRGGRRCFVGRAGRITFGCCVEARRFSHKLLLCGGDVKHAGISMLDLKKKSAD